MSAFHQHGNPETLRVVGRTSRSPESTGQPIVNELVIVGLIETMIIRKESFRDEMSTIQKGGIQ